MKIICSLVFKTTLEKFSGIIFHLNPSESAKSNIKEIIINVEKDAKRLWDNQKILKNFCLLITCEILLPIVLIILGFIFGFTQSAIFGIFLTLLFNILFVYINFENFFCSHKRVERAFYKKASKYLKQLEEFNVYADSNGLRVSFYDVTETDSNFTFFNNFLTGNIFSQLNFQQNLEPDSSEEDSDFSDTDSSVESD